jgi:acyl-CoA dehydrogenase
MSRPLLETDEHAALREQARRFAQEQIAPHALEWEEAGGFPRELYRLIAETGLPGLGYPEEAGGQGGDLSHVLAVQEELVLHGTSVGTAVGLGSHRIALPPILRFGTPEQVDRFVRPVLAGERIAALAVTEPGAGSDVAAIQTRARRDGDHYVVDGAKTFITSGVRADQVTAAVRTGGDGHGGISLLVIERDTPGYSVGRALEKMGWRASDTAELHFDGCRVPVANLLGPENGGFGILAANFVEERLMLAGSCVAIAELAYQESVKYAKERRAFGKTLLGFQVTRHRLAEAATRIETVRAFLAEAVARHLRGDDCAKLAAMVKNAASDMVLAVCDTAVQVHGGYGYMRESVVERLYRDARLYPIGGGTREMMCEIVAKLEGY